MSSPETPGQAGTPHVREALHTARTHATSETPGLTARTARRTLIQGAVWSVPVIAVAVAAPATAASRACPVVNTPSTWTQTYSRVLGDGFSPRHFNQYGGTEIALTTRNAESFLSIQDARPASAGSGTVTLATTFTPVAGQTYTFSFTARGRAGQTLGQTLAIRLAGTQVWAAATRTGMGPTIIITNNQANYSITWTAPNSNATSLEYVFFLPATNGNNDDLRITLPVVTSPYCV
ncbi:hypothetical protein [Pseudoclavibacter helvolus]|uniref:hypothetical protein n=1 Tax=Pseudoclavibacter helvolus TaxID=255205 RepID=UPI003C729A71